MGKNEIVNLTPEEIVDLLVANLSECNRLVSVLGKKSSLDEEELRKIKNSLMFTRTKARNLAKALDELKKPVNSFKFSV